MKLYITRDSVAAMDDAFAPHAKTITAPAVTTIEALIDTVARKYPLPQITGGEATWVLASGVPLAVFAQQWKSPRREWRMASDLAELDDDGEVVRLHFSYLAQHSPDAVLEVVRQLRLRAL